MWYMNVYINLKEKIAYALRLPSGVASPSLVNEKEFSYLPVILVYIPSLWREEREREAWCNSHEMTLMSQIPCLLEFKNTVMPNSL